MITLYARRLCPYCWKVKRKLRALGLEYETEYVSFIPPLRSEVKAISGQSQVPVLVDPAYGVGGMAESDDIVAYLEETYGGVDGRDRDGRRRVDSDDSERQCERIPGRWALRFTARRSPRRRARPPAGAGGARRPRGRRSRATVG